MALFLLLIDTPPLPKKKWVEAATVYKHSKGTMRSWNTSQAEKKKKEKHLIKNKEDTIIRYAWTKNQKQRDQEEDLLAYERIAKLQHGKNKS